MKKHFICLANSKKYSGRCIAGIEVRRKPKGGWEIVKAHQRPKWIRPVVYRSNHGELDEKSVENIQLLDVVEMDVVRNVPQGYQSENVLFQPTSLKKVSFIGCTVKNLNVLTDKNYNQLFGSPTKYVGADQIQKVHHSLMMIKPETLEIYYPVVYKTYDPRARIIWKGQLYDLAVTDIGLIKKMQENPDWLKGFCDFWVTISLGIAFKGRYYKIAAGILYL